MVSFYVTEGFGYKKLIWRSTVIKETKGKIKGKEK
jgi:hypothetical protein